MDVLYPERLPETGADLLAFVKENRIALNHLYVEHAKEVVSTLSDDEIAEKFAKGTEEHGAWSLTCRNPFFEERLEHIDGINYFAWGLLLKHFSAENAA